MCTIITQSLLLSSAFPPFPFPFPLLNLAKRGVGWSEGLSGPFLCCNWKEFGLAAYKTLGKLFLQFPHALIVQFRILMSFALNLMAYFTHLLNNGISLH